MYFATHPNFKGSYCSLMLPVDLALVQTENEADPVPEHRATSWDRLRNKEDEAVYQHLMTRLVDGRVVGNRVLRIPGTYREMADLARQVDIAFDRRSIEDRSLVIASASSGDDVIAVTWAVDPEDSLRLASWKMRHAIYAGRPVCTRSQDRSVPDHFRSDLEALTRRLRTGKLTELDPAELANRARELPASARSEAPALETVGTVEIVDHQAGPPGEIEQVTPTERRRRRPVARRALSLEAGSAGQGRSQEGGRDQGSEFLLASRQLGHEIPGVEGEPVLEGAIDNEEVMDEAGTQNQGPAYRAGLVGDDARGASGSSRLVIDSSVVEDAGSANDDRGLENTL